MNPDCMPVMYEEGPWEHARDARYAMADFRDLRRDILKLRLQIIRQVMEMFRCMAVAGSDR